MDCLYMKNTFVFLKTLIFGAITNLFVYGYSMGRRFPKKSSTNPYTNQKDISHLCGECLFLFFCDK